LNLGSSPVQTKSQEADDVDSYGSQMAQLEMERDAAYQERDAVFQEIEALKDELAKADRASQRLRQILASCRGLIQTGLEI
jgi:uncharacterized protein (DUF3084 family)